MSLPTCQDIPWGRNFLVPLHRIGRYRDRDHNAVIVVLDIFENDRSTNVSSVLSSSGRLDYGFAWSQRTLENGNAVFFSDRIVHRPNDASFSCGYPYCSPKSFFRSRSGTLCEVGRFPELAKHCWQPARVEFLHQVFTTRTKVDDRGNFLTELIPVIETPV